MPDTAPCWPPAPLPPRPPGAGWPEDASTELGERGPRRSQEAAPCWKSPGATWRVGLPVSWPQGGCWDPQGVGASYLPSPRDVGKASCWQHIAGTVLASGVPDLVLGLPDAWEDRPPCSAHGREAGRRRGPPAGAQLGAALDSLRSPPLARPPAAQRPVLGWASSRLSSFPGDWSP